MKTIEINEGEEFILVLKKIPTIGKIKTNMSIYCDSIAYPALGGFYPDLRIYYHKTKKK